MKTKKYIAIQYQSGENTTTGSPNKLTGRLDHAINIAVFTKKSDRYKFISDRLTWLSVTARESRNLCLGDSVAEYNDYLESIIDITLDD